MFHKFLEKKSITVDQFKAMKAAEQAELQNEYLGTLEKMIADKATMEGVKEELKNLVSKEEFEKLDKDIEELAEKMAKLSENRGEVKKTLKEALKTQIEANKTKPEAQRQINVALKVDNLFNIEVIDGGDFNLDEANIDSLLLSESAIETGFAPDLRRELTLLSEMTNATPLRVGDALKWIEPQDATGKPLTVKEANEKPIGTVKYVRKSKESTKIAIYFQVSEEFLNRADYLMTLINTHFRELVTEVLEEVAFDATNGILSYATTYVNPVGYEIEDPNRFDALGAVATSMKLSKYRPSHIVMNAADIAMMFGAKATDGHYILENGTTMQLADMGQTLIMGARRLKIIEVDSDLIAIGTFAMIDWSKLKYGLGSVRTKSDPYTNMRDNIINFLMEAPFAVARPANYPYAVVSDTFANVITAITPAP